MRLRVLAVCAATAFTVVAAPVAAEAAAPAYRVAISTPRSNPDVGQALVLSGWVSGPKSAKKTLLVQRRIGAGGWTTVRRIKTTKKSRYAAVVVVPTAGAQSYRVVAPASKVRSRGISAARSLTGWRWLDATAKAVYDDLGPATLTIHGKTYPKALTPTGGGSGTLYVDTTKACDVLSYSFGTEGTTTSTSGSTTNLQLSSQLQTVLTVSGMMATGGQAPGTGRWQLRPDTAFVIIDVGGGGPVGQRAGIIAPRLHCSVNALPKTVLPVL